MGASAPADSGVILAAMEGVLLFAFLFASCLVKKDPSHVERLCVSCSFQHQMHACTQTLTRMRAHTHAHTRRQRKYRAT